MDNNYPSRLTTIMAGVDGFTIIHTSNEIFYDLEGDRTNLLVARERYQ